MLHKVQNAACVEMAYCPAEEKRQRAGALQDASRGSGTFEERATRFGVRPPCIAFAPLHDYIRTSPSTIMLRSIMVLRHSTQDIDCVSVPRGFAPG